MFVKHTPTDPEKRLVTEARAADIDREWDARYQATRQADMAAARSAQLRSRAGLVRNAAIVPKARFVAGPSAPDECRRRHSQTVLVSDPLVLQLAPCARESCACVWVPVVPGYRQTTGSK